MSYDKILSGQQFGRLTTLNRTHAKKKDGRLLFKWICRCACGNQVSVIEHKIKGGHTKSCGCFRRDDLSKRRKKHGLSLTKTYRIWHTMKNRCFLKKNNSYANYGARGIKVCER